MGPAYQKVAGSGLLPTEWLQQTWYEALRLAPSQPLAAYVRSPAFLLLTDWLQHFLYRNETMPVKSSLIPTVRRYLEEGFCQYTDLAPQLAQRISDLLHYLEHSTLPSTSGPE